MAAHSHGSSGGRYGIGSVGHASRAEVRRSRSGSLRHPIEWPRQNTRRAHKNSPQTLRHQGTTEEERKRKEARKGSREACGPRAGSCAKNKNSRRKRCSQSQIPSRHESRRRKKEQIQKVIWSAAPRRRFTVATHL